MKTRQKSLVLLLLASLAGCGQQLVEFGPPVVPPTVTSTIPANAAVGVAINSKVSALFSTAMDATTLTATTFTVSKGATPVAGSVATVGPTATFSPAANLAASTTYVGTIKAGVKDSSGNALAADYVWTFTTAATVDPTPPTVTSTIPVNLATNVPLAQKVNAFFSKAMDPTTLTSTTFTLTQGTPATPVAGTVGYASVNAVATFTPTAPLTAGTKYTATVTTGAKDVGGNALAANYVWTFTTTAAAIAPQVVSTNPPDGATNLCIPVKVDATFDKLMDPQTINSANYTLAGPGTAPVQGAVSYDSLSKTASFLPSNSLAGSTTYTATVTTGVKDASGNALAANKVFSFTTNTNPCLPLINLRSLGRFVAVAGAGLTNSNTQLPNVTTLNGDVGLSPTATCMSDGSPCNPAAGAPKINGTLYANDPAGIAAAAKADLVSAYNDAQGRPPGTVVVANLAGQVLPPGVYTSQPASSMDIAVNGTVTLDAQGDQNAAWIFQIGSTLTANNGSKVALINGAKAGNVFWAIGSSSTIGSNVDFKGTVMAQSSNSVGTGSVVEGRLVCTTGAITLLSNVITLPAP